MTRKIILAGLNHTTAEVNIRERYALPHCNLRECGLISSQGPVVEALALSTCNRVEILAVAEAGVPADTVLQLWAAALPGMAQSDISGSAAACQSSVGQLKEHTYIYEDMEAVAHVFSVASSLDSMMVGEPQILGQMKEAYNEAVENKTAKVLINRLMHKAFFVAKRVRTETGIASSAVSISYAAVQLAKRIFGDMPGVRALLVGAGEMAELAALHLMNAGVCEIIVTNRTFSHAEKLAAQFKGTPVPFEKFIQQLTEVDIIISSTGAPATLLQAKDLQPVLRQRRNKPMFFIDIAVPRDIDPDVNTLDNVYLYDIDDLKEVVEENREKRRQEALKAQKIIHTETQQFATWLDALQLQPTITDLLAKGNRTGQQELAKTLRRLGGDTVPQETRQALEALVASMVHKLYSEPIHFLRRRSQEEEAIQRFIDVTRRMFHLDNEPVPPDAHSQRKKLKE